MATVLVIIFGVAILVMAIFIFSGRSLNDLLESDSARWQKTLDDANKPVVKPLDTPFDETIERIILRDYHTYPPGIIRAALARLDDSYGQRIRLAVLKNGNGHLQGLLKEIGLANLDWSIVLSTAEFPRSTEHHAETDPDKKRIVTEADLHQYNDWLNRE